MRGTSSELGMGRESSTRSELLLDAAFGDVLSNESLCKLRNHFPHHTLDHFPTQGNQCCKLGTCRIQSRLRSDFL